MTDPVQLTADLIRCPSVTPEEGGAIQLLEKLLSEAGFRTQRPDRNGIANLYAVWGESGQTLGFNGHTDVVPTGDENAWDHPPFAAEIRDGIMFGRGAQDMKSADAAFVAAAIDFVTNTPPEGRIAIAITGDEEGDGVDGTKAILDWMEEAGEKIDHCIVGEPTCPANMGEMIKIGRRGSITAYLTATGTQGHSAYPHKANNPIPAMVHLLDRFASMELDQGTDHFDPSTLAITSVDVGNRANNVIPAEIRAMMNIRFNDRHSSDSLSEMIRAEAALVSGKFGVEIDVRFRVTGESFITEPGPFVELVAKAVEAVTGVTPELSTTGGTSDARYIKYHCPVVEFGLVGNTMHQINERVPVDEITALRDVYARVLKDYFSG